MRVLQALKASGVLRDIEMQCFAELARRFADRGRLREREVGAGTRLMRGGKPLVVNFSLARIPRQIPEQSSLLYSANLLQRSMGDALMWLSSFVPEVLAACWRLQRPTAKLRTRR